jgi:hypothetical protein
VPLQLTVHTAPTYEFEWGPSGCDVHTLTVVYEGAVQWHLFTIETRKRPELAGSLWGYTGGGTILQCWQLAQWAALHRRVNAPP